MSRPQTRREPNAAKPAHAPKRNLPADQRRRVLLDAAMELFAEAGMRITVQALADRVNVTQPLVHRYFPTKADLIAAICDRIQNAYWNPGWRDALTDRSRPLDQRIVEFYGAYLPHIYAESWYRGFWYAALTDPDFARPFIVRVERELLVSIVDEVRFRNGYPPVATVPVFAREMELVWGMHSTMVFVGIRRYVYHTDVSDDIEATAIDQMRGYLLVAPAVLGDLMPAHRKRRTPAPARAAAGA